MKLKISNTYEAAYYRLNGGQINNITFSRLPENTAKKKVRQGIAPIKYIFEMSNIPPEAIKAWRENRPMANVKDLMFARLKIKKKVAQVKYDYHLNNIGRG